MTLLVTAGGRDSDSYVTLSEMEEYIGELYPEAEVEGWLNRAEEQQEQCLRIAVLFVDELSLRGCEACRDQNLKFPRWWRTDDEYPTYEDQYIEMEDISGYDDPKAPDRYNRYGNPPIVPMEVKRAQMEMAFRVVHGQLLAADSGLMEYPEHEVRSFTLGGGMTIDFFSRTSGETTAWGKSKFTSMSITQAYLQKWIRHFVGGVV